MGITDRIKRIRMEAEMKRQGNTKVGSHWEPWNTKSVEDQAYQENKFRYMKQAAVAKGRERAKKEADHYRNAPSFGQSLLMGGQRMGKGLGKMGRGLGKIGNNMSRETRAGGIFETPRHGLLGPEPRRYAPRRRARSRR